MTNRRMEVVTIVAAAVISALAVGCTEYPRKHPNVPQISQESKSVEAIDSNVYVAETEEVELVETMAMHRSHYMQYLRALYRHYLQNGDAFRADLALREIEGLRVVEQFKYLRSRIDPIPYAQARDSIPKADGLYREGRSLKDHASPLGITNREQMMEALFKFKRLIKKYPESDKVDDAAYHIAEIYHITLSDYQHAVVYYLRAFQFDSSTPWPAAYRAAKLYDSELLDRDKALELYWQVVKHDRDKDNVEFASSRIKALVADTTAKTVN